MLIDDDTSLSAIDSDNTAIVFLSSETCKHCNNFDKKFRDAAEGQYGQGMDFFKINAVAHREDMYNAGVTALPTVMAFKGGSPIDPKSPCSTSVGNIPAESFNEWLKNVATNEECAPTAKSTHKPLDSKAWLKSLNRPNKG